MNLAQVKAKARLAVKRREETLEQDEIEAGELNLIPYLDIVTNLMLFLLAMSVAGFALGQIDTTLPDHAKAATKPAVDPKQKEPSLQLVASVTKRNIIVWSVSGLEGTLQQPRAVVSRLDTGNEFRYDYPKLNKTLFEIASKRWKDKLRPVKSYEIILMADGDIPYGTIVAIMDNLRRRLPDEGQPEKRVTLPEMEGEGKDAKVVEKYDPTQHYLFPDILFSSGFD